MVLRTPFTVNNAPAIIARVAAHRLPAMYETRNYVDAGGLMLYGPSFADLYRRSAGYVDKILKGASPADIPVEQPSRFEFVINQKTAHALGLSIPEPVLARADEVVG
jgi:putative ABC transport system substrate-binding protein